MVTLCTADPNTITTACNCLNNQELVFVKNTVEFEGWQCWPVHCPFCGGSTAAELVNAGEHCRHLVYVAVEGRLVFWSSRLGGGELEGERVQNEHLDIAHTLPNYVQFKLNDPGGWSLVAFAAHEDELCGWGMTSRDPRRS